MKHSDMSKDKPMMKKVAAKAVKGHEKKLHGMKSGGMAVKKMAKGGGCEVKGKTKGTMVKMARGGDLMMARGGMTMMRGGGVKKMRG